MNYQQEVHQLIDSFYTFNIIVVPRYQNLLVDSLATITSRLSPLKGYEATRFTIKFLYKPFILDIVTSWRVFEGDQ